jgi:hypothetical protein
MHTLTHTHTHTKSQKNLSLEFYFKFHETKLSSLFMNFLTPLIGVLSATVHNVIARCPWNVDLLLHTACSHLYCSLLNTQSKCSLAVLCLKVQTLSLSECMTEFAETGTFFVLPLMWNDLHEVS